jgi:hypothetical protein
MAEFTYFATEQPLALIAATLFASQGGWLRRRLAGATDTPPEETSDKGFIMSGVLGLLALLIAFTFSLAVSRYETRRGLVMEDANAIGTAEMRVQLLDAPHGQQLSQMLRRYARTRLEFGQAGALEKPPLVRSSEAQRAAIQTATLAALEPIKTGPLAPFVGASINSVLDVGVEREAQLAARVPGTVLVALVSYIVLSAGVLGYALTGARARQRPATIILFALLTLAITMILDLDRPQGGTIRTDQTALVRLVAGFAPETGQAAIARPAVSSPR